MNPAFGNIRWLTLAVVAVLPLYAADVSPLEFKTRRAELIRRVPDGIALLHGRGDFLSQNAWYGHAQHQDPSFYYFSGREMMLPSILAVDGISKETWLFSPITPALLGSDTAATPGIDHAAPWEEFVPWLEKRLASIPAPVLYVDDTDSWWTLRLYGPAIEPSNPPGLDPIEDSKLLWRRALERRWPGAKVRSASPLIQEMRLVKSPAEIEFMRAAGKASVVAWFRGAAAIGDGASPRQVEAEVVRGCVDAGAQGPSHWPEVGEYNSGYYHLPKLPVGKLIFLDVGCDLDRYQTDIKRMVPVSGRFTPEQKEMWELFLAVYRAGLSAIRDGARRSDVFEAAVHEAERRKTSARSSPARKTAEGLMDSKRWLLHSMGLECCEGEPGILRDGMIVAFEPGILVDGQILTIEDETLVKRDGYEILAPLPYEAAAIEQAMRRPRK